VTTGTAAMERRRRDARGRRAEALCAWLLRLKGYRILARRLRTPQGEIDLIARRGRVLAFVEVKARATKASAVESIGEHQRRRIERAALRFVAGRSDLADLQPRFDVMIVVPGRAPIHLRGAWRPAAA